MQLYSVLSYFTNSVLIECLDVHVRTCIYVVKYTMFVLIVVDIFFDFPTYVYVYLISVSSC